MKLFGNKWRRQFCCWLTTFRRKNLNGAILWTTMKIYEYQCFRIYWMFNRDTSHCSHNSGSVYFYNSFETHYDISHQKKKYLELCNSYNLFTYFRSAFCIVITVWYFHEFNSIFNFSIFIDKYTDKKSVSFSNFLITMRKTLNSEKLLKNRDA